ncbi:hypothetical protein [Herpetosiphon gulosus]|uniref:Swt1-like HEPN domain-containing protein n=1 Tax=Herpetosiphon gulosus TaxID=1973496 RepID=A0ABP9X087_9CHLR
MPITLDELTAQLQRRVARLLLQHDRATFHGRFREFYQASSLPPIALLQAYDLLTKVLVLADELFDDILARIHRQMSFQATREHLNEHSPIRGQIDWGRSLQQAWNQFPDQPPMSLQTTLRSRSFATPQNRLVVAGLQRYRQLIEQLLSETMLSDVPLTEFEQRDLSLLLERIQRELARPHLQELNRESELANLPELIAEVSAAATGSQNAYRDLVVWLQKLEQLHIQASGTTSAFSLGKAEQAGLLYQLWLALEILDLLKSKDCLIEPIVRVDRLQLHFKWHDHEYELIYDQAPTAQLAWSGAPSERPDYLIKRRNSLKVEYDGRTIWQEPSVILDAKCYLGDKASRTTNPIKRMLGDLQLIDAHHGALILPTIEGLQMVVKPDPERYHGVVFSDSQIQLFELAPMQPQSQLEQAITAILEYAIKHLPERPAIDCHGAWPDVDTWRPQQGQHPIPINQDLIFCPKPHIDPARVDLVSHVRDCLRNPKRCHIMQPQIQQLPPYVKRVLNVGQLQTAIAQLKQHLNQQVTVEATDGEADVARQQLLERVGELVDSYRAFIKPDIQSIEEKLHWVFRQYANRQQHAHGLPQTVWDMLVSGEFAWSEFSKHQVTDWAAVAVQYVRAVEHELKQRLYYGCGGDNYLKANGTKPLKEKNFTFGTVNYALEHCTNEVNWNIFVQRAMAFGHSEATFKTVVSDLMQLYKLRNEIAHSSSISRQQAEFVRTVTIGKPGEEGALLRFIKLIP